MSECDCVPIMGGQSKRVCIQREGRVGFAGGVQRAERTICRIVRMDNAQGPVRRRENAQTVVRVEALLGRVGWESSKAAVRIGDAASRLGSLSYSPKSDEALCRARHEHGPSFRGKPSPRVVPHSPFLESERKMSRTWHTLWMFTENVSSTEILANSKYAFTDAPQKPLRRHRKPVAPPPEATPLDPSPSSMIPVKYDDFWSHLSHLPSLSRPTAAASSSRSIPDLINERKATFKQPDFVFNPETDFSTSTPVRPPGLRSHLLENTNLFSRPLTPDSAPEEPVSAAYMRRSHSFQLTRAIPARFQDPDFYGLSENGECEGGRWRTRTVTPAEPTVEMVQDAPKLNQVRLRVDKSTSELRIPEWSNNER
ncbi:hypothetical protein C8R44DRAFT_846584 [Mycena epipterygia]|nr:hypothetical protein C8R44DRAFT_846584 [Mycena epipterygia]